MLIFRQLFDPRSSTYTYLLGDGGTGRAVFIDTVFEQAARDKALAGELGLAPVAVLDTHVHADHVTGAWLAKEHFGAQICVAAKGGAAGADRLLGDADRVEFGSRYLEVRETPGHTAGCLTFVLDDETMAFTGDCLLIRGSGRTDFQQGDATALYRSVHARIFTLPDNCLLYPAHDYRGLTVTSVAEEKAFNPRLGGALSETDFTGYVGNLGLAHPKNMDAAVPANLKCGRPEAGAGRAGTADAPDWAPLTYTFAGFWEIEPHWVEENLGRIQIIDVREPDEFNGRMGHIPGAKLIPLGELESRVGEIAKDKPAVTVCRAGGRSAQATVILKNAGFEDVANLMGGMLNWRAQRFEAIEADGG